MIFLCQMNLFDTNICFWQKWRAQDDEKTPEILYLCALNVESTPPNVN